MERQIAPGQAAGNKIYLFVCCLKCRKCHFKSCKSKIVLCVWCNYMHSSEINVTAAYIVVMKYPEAES